MSSSRESESVIQQAIRRALGLVPGLVLFRNTVGTCTEFDAKGRSRVIKYGLADGSSDLVGCYNGCFVGLEVKRPGEHSKPHQLQWAELIRYNGGMVAEVSSVTQAEEFICSVRDRGTIEDLRAENEDLRKRVRELEAIQRRRA